jgi:hypothetical protein
MRAVVAILVQLIMTFLIVGAVMPLILLTVSIRGRHTGPAIVVVLLLAVFAAIRAVWPRPPRRG